MARKVKHKALEPLFLSKTGNIGQNSTIEELREFGKMRPVTFLFRDPVYSVQRLTGPGKCWIKLNVKDAVAAAFPCDQISPRYGLLYF